METTLVENETVQMPEGGMVEIDHTYKIEVASGANILLTLAFTKPAMFNFDHPNIVRKAMDVLEFKHSRKNGSKYWTTKAGVEITFCVPKNKIQIIKEKRFSYPKVVVGGQVFTLNVSGMTTQNGWLDIIGSSAHTLCDVSKKVLMAVAEAATPPEKDRSFDQEKVHLGVVGNNMEQMNTSWLKEYSKQIITLRTSTKIALNGISDMRFTVMQVKGQRVWIRSDDGRIMACKRKDIDMLRTAQENGLTISIPTQFSCL